MKANMNIKSIIMIMTVIYLASMLFINMSFAANTGKISVETAKLREEPNTDCKVLELMSQGEEVEILSEEDEWYKIKYKKITGYVRQDLVQVENKTENTNNETKNTSTETEQPTNEVSTETTTETNTQQPTNEVSAETTTEQKEEIVVSEKYKISENVRLKVIPLISAIELDELAKDTEIKVTEILNNWIKVETTDGKTGWIRNEKVQTKAQEKAQTTTVAKTMYVNSQTINVRQEPSTSSELVKQLSLNTKVNVLSTENGWSYVEIDGVNAYISERLLSSTKQTISRSATTTRNTQSTSKTQTTQTQTNTTPKTEAVSTTPTTSSSGNDIVAYAKQFLGCRYVYGGTTTNGFDCSGFTQYVYRHFGVNLNRTAAAQYSNGKSVSDLQPGDLLMFGKAGINHVGIYIGGNTFIHAANSRRGVTTDSISSGYYKANYVGARRVL